MTEQGHRPAAAGDGPSEVEGDPLWLRVKPILASALDLPVEERGLFLDRMCEGEAALRTEIDRYLEGASRSLLPDRPLPGQGLLASSVVREAGGAANEDGEWIGRRIGAYQLTHQLGRGGMGQVFGAERADGEFEQQVAVKLMHSGWQGRALIRRFEAERRILATLEHPGIARLIDGGTTDQGLLYLVMERVKGTRLDVYCRDHQLDLDERVRLFCKVCDAVGFAHRQLVVHRDIKPANILVTDDGQPKLLDFGIAKIDSPDSERTETFAPRPMTPGYASPEQLAGRPVSTASDIYSLGIVLYELLTDCHPFRDSSAEAAGSSEPATRGESRRRPTKPSQVVTRDSEDVVPGAGSWSKRLRGDLDIITMRALDPDPERRFGSAGDLSEDLRRSLDGLPIRSRSDSLAYTTSKFIRRQPALVAAVTVLFALTVALVVTTVLKNRQLTVLNRALVLERDRANESVELLVDSLQMADPVRTKGQNPTVAEALARALAELEESPPHPATHATLLDAVGRVYASQGELVEARKILEKAVQLRRQASDARDPLLAAGLQNLAHALRLGGELDAAEAALREAITRHRQLEPRRLSELAAALNDLGSLLLDRNQLAEARELVFEGLALKRSIGASAHDLSISANTLATIYMRQGDVRESEKLYREVAEIRRALDPDSMATAKALNNLGSLLANWRGRPEEAQEIFLESLRIREQIFGPDHPSIAVVLNNLALTLLEMDDIDGAAEALDRAKRLLGKPPPRQHLAQIEKHQAMVAAARGDFDLCIELADKSIEGLSTRRLGRSRQAPSSTFEDARSIRASCLSEAGDLEAAGEILLDSFSRLKVQNGMNHRQTRAALERLERHFGLEEAGRLAAEAERAVQPRQGSRFSGRV